MKVISIDPGDVQSAAVLIDATYGIPLETCYASNRSVKAWLRSQSQPFDAVELVIEFTPPYTMTMGNGRSFVPSQVVDTAIEIGRFVEFWDTLDFSDAHLLSRLDVKKHLLGKTNGTDSMIRAALMDRFGGERLAVGAKKCELCKGRGTSGFIFTECYLCKGGKRVLGSRGPKKCPDCRGKGSVKGLAATCEACKGAKWAIPPGPMNGITADLYAALAVGLTYCDQNKLIQD